MEIEQALDPVAIYGALLSSALGIAQLYKWWSSGPTASVQVYNPLAVARFGRRFYEIVVSNNGAIPVVVERVRISAYENRNSRKPFGTVRFDTRSAWNPSLRSVPSATKPNTSSYEVNVIPIGGELHELLGPFSDYDPTKHWVRAEVKLRNSNRLHTAWAAPVILEMQP